MSELYPDDELFGSFTPELQKERRLAEISTWFAAFEAYCLREGDFQVCWKDNVADALNGLYWEQMNESVRPRIKSSSGGSTVRADRHKIASLMELLIVYLQPVQSDQLEVQTDINARLAFYVATNIIGNWNDGRFSDLYVSESFDREHRTWLMLLTEDPEGWPVFSNAATWYMVELLYLERSKAH